MLQYEAYRRIDATGAALTGRPIAGRELSADAGRARPAQADAIHRARAAAMSSSPGILLAGWEYLGSIPAHAEFEFNMIVPTLEDSSATDPWPAAYSAFFVRAATAAPSIFYDSSVDSGYSVDNPPPAVPALVVAAYAGGATHVHWGANTEPDFWYHRLYRGRSAGFVAGTANLIATASDTGYADLGPACGFYKLSAVDVNGNESGFASITPNGTTAVPGDAPLAFALKGVRPNPSSGYAFMIEFVLPDSDPASLEVIDLMGRCVSVRQVGSLGKGHHRVDAAAGRHLPPGIYLVRLTQGTSARTTRVKVL